ncbi:MAG: SRPBCC family protein [Rhodobacteraceae bacterium]|nr:SRPBCC family protein [Paracoccaceae bacterium]
MKLSTRDDIEAPIETVFSVVSDFARFERMAQAKGAQVARTDDLTEAGIGMGWDARFRFRGKPREARLELTRYDRPEALTVTSRMGGIESEFTIDLIALSPRRTRMIVGLDLRPRTLSARLLIQSLKFAKANLERRFTRQVARAAREIERR